MLFGIPKWSHEFGSLIEITKISQTNIVNLIVNQMYIIKEYCAVIKIRELMFLHIQNID